MNTTEENNTFAKVTFIKFKGRCRVTCYSKKKNAVF